MNQDTIIGLSVLQPTWIDGIYRLWFKAARHDGQFLQGWIFIKDGRAQGLPERMPDFPEGCNTIWKFTRLDDGGNLACWPSVNWTSGNFHNAAQWQTTMVEMTLKERPWSASDLKQNDPPREHRGDQIHYELNFTGATAEQTAGYLAELRAGGWLK